MTELLLVADLPWVADAVRAALSPAGYHLRVTTEPAAAAALCREHRPAAVLIDLQVASRGGMAVVRDLRAAAHDAGTPPPPTLLLLDRAVDAFLARRAGADAWIRKPFGGLALRRVVAGLAAAADPGAAPA